MHLHYRNGVVFASKSWMFSDCSSLTALTLGEHFDTSNVTDMEKMFSGCSSIKALDLGERFDTSNVQRMSWMFENCSSLTELNLGEHFVTPPSIQTEMFENCPADMQLLNR